MPTDTSFKYFLRRIRSGDQQAAEELVRQYEPIIRREVRMRLTDPALYRLVDSVDICQSVLRSFFVRAAAGQYDLHQPDDLLKLLVIMARNKLASQARKLRSRPPDHRRVKEGNIDQLGAVVAAMPGPYRLIAGRDLLHEVLHKLPEEERRLADLRAEGRTWSEITIAVGGTPEGRRKQLARALDRIMRELGDEEIFSV